MPIAQPNYSNYINQRIMNSLLKRQIRKYLSEDLKANEELSTFLDAVDKSYHNYDNQFSMLQRAVKLSSEELFESNTQLKKESEDQKEIIKKLNNVINSLKFYELEDVSSLDNSDSLKLVDIIEKQTNEIIKINKQKNKLLFSLRRQNQELNDYAHMVSHDLKSPLQSIDALTNWLKEDYSDTLGDKGKEIVKLLDNNVVKMDTLINSALEYSSIGKIKRKNTEINIHNLVHKIIKKMHQNTDITIKIVKPLPTIYGDSYKLELIFRHLISNAIKFNDKKEHGFVEIDFIEEENNWQFSVRDNGIGIKEEYFNKIFVAFNKLYNNYKSSGLGLTIVKKIVLDSGGRIWLSSKLNKETIFYFTLKK